MAIVFAIFMILTSSPVFILGANAKFDPVMRPGRWQRTANRAAAIKRGWQAAVGLC